MNKPFVLVKTNIWVHHQTADPNAWSTLNAHKIALVTRVNATILAQEHVVLTPNVELLTITHYVVVPRECQEIHFPDVTMNHVRL